MRKLGYAALAAAMTLTIGGHAFAATLVGTTANATGLLGLDVGGTLYDVDFHFQTYDAVYGGPDNPLFEGDPAGAYAASLALESALNSLGVSGVDGVTAARGLIAVVIPEAPLNADYVNMQHVIYNYVSPGLWAAYGVGSVYYQATYDHNVIADFRLAGGVPEPETWTLMISGFGLAGAALRARRRQLSFNWAQRTPASPSAGPHLRAN